TDATVDVTVNGNLGSDCGTVIEASSSGDTTVDATDDWFTSNDSPDYGDPALGHVFQGPGATLTATSASLTGCDNISWTFHTTIAAGARQVFMFFAIQKGPTDDAASMAEATRLVALPDDSMVGMDDYLGDLMNFQGDTPGAPQIRFSGSTMANE